MATSALFRQVEYRLANHYLSRLRKAETAYQQGHENSAIGLSIFDQEWSQIQQWYNWSAAHAMDLDEIATLCKEYTQVGAELFLLRQHPHECRKWLEVGLEVAKRQGDRHSEMIHQFLLGRLNFHTGAFLEAQVFAERALRLAQQLDHQLYMCKTLCVLGGIFYGQDEYDRALMLFEQALDRSEALRARTEIGQALNGLGNIALSRGIFDRAHYYYMQCLEIAELDGKPRPICMALRNLGTVSKRLGDEAAALTYAKRATALSRSVGYQACLAECLALLGTLESARGNLDDALDYLRESLDLSRLVCNQSNEAYVLSQLGYYLSQHGDYTASLEHLEAALAVSEKTGERWFTALALLNMTEVFRAAGEIESAFRRFCEGLEIACAIHSNAMWVKYLLEASLLWYEKGQVRQAAIWTGLVQEQLYQLSSEQRGLYDRLLRNLEDSLSKQQFQSANEQGRGLDLDSVMQGILRELSTG